MISAETGAPFEATYDAGETGLVGTLEVRIDDNQGATVFGPSAVGIIELGATGVYRANLTGPAITEDLEQFTILWSEDGTFDADTGATEDLLVSEASGIAALPPLASPEGEEFAPGPCRAWTDGEAIAECCDAIEGESIPPELDEIYARMASEILNFASGQQFPGECGPITVRPCNRPCGCWPAGTSGYSWDGRRGVWACGTAHCGCRPLSEIRLDGFVREIVEVKIDGETLDEDEYRLDEHRTLVRMRDPDDPDTRLTWPSCQIIDLDDTEEGTFAITYTHGLDPPLTGQRAAAALACQLYRACTPGAGDCELPDNVTNVVRAGVTYKVVAPIAALLQAGATGIYAIDVFMATYGTKRRSEPTVFSPDIQWPRTVAPGGS